MSSQCNRMYGSGQHTNPHINRQYTKHSINNNRRKKSKGCTKESNSLKLYFQSKIRLFDTRGDSFKEERCKQYLEPQGKGEHNILKGWQDGKGRICFNKSIFHNGHFFIRSQFNCDRQRIKLQLSTHTVANALCSLLLYRPYSHRGHPSLMSLLGWEAALGQTLCASRINVGNLI